MEEVYYEVKIDETYRKSLAETPHYLQQIKEECESVGAVNGFLVDHYGKMPKGRNKVYVNGPDGEPVEVGFLHSYWVKDYAGSFFQTDWISVKKIRREVVLIKNINKESGEGA